MDKGNPKSTNGVLACDNEDIPLDFGPNNLVGGGKGGGRRERKEREKREKKKEEREAPPSL